MEDTVLEDIRDSKDKDCTCDEGNSSHTCPYALEINEDDSLCNCCDYCTNRCGENI